VIFHICFASAALGHGPVAIKPSPKGLATALRHTVRLRQADGVQQFLLLLRQLLILRRAVRSDPLAVRVTLSIHRCRHLRPARDDVSRSTEQLSSRQLVAMVQQKFLISSAAHPRYANEESVSQTLRCLLITHKNSGATHGHGHALIGSELATSEAPVGQ